MSEQRLRGAFMGVAMTAATLAAAPAIAESCAPLSANFELCTEGTPWAEAEWFQFGDGASIQMGPYYIELTEHWIAGDARASLEDTLDALLAEMLEADRDEGMAPPETLLRDTFEAGALTVVREVVSIDMDDDMPMLMATMVAEGEGTRIAVMFSHDDTVALDELGNAAQGFVALIRPAQEG